MIAEHDDPEMSYRRGYQQCAQQLFEVLQPFLPPDAREIVRQWVGRDLANWRVAAMRGESKRGSVGITVGEYPPTWRLGNLSQPNAH